MSYIPRSSITSPTTPGAIPKLVKQKHTFRVFGFIATVLIIAALLSVVATYAYGYFSEGRLEKAKVQLLEISAKNTDADMKELETFDRQLTTANQILDNHIAPSKLFEEIERATKGTVQFTSFTYTYDPGFQALLQMTGGTNELMSAALQKAAFNKDESSLFTDFVVSEINANVTDPETLSDAAESLDTTQYPVVFSLKGSLEKMILTYTGDDVSESEVVPETAVAEEEMVPADTESSVEEGDQAEPVVTE